MKALKCAFFCFKNAIYKGYVKNYHKSNKCHISIYKPNSLENVYIYEIVNYIMSVN